MTHATGSDDRARAREFPFEPIVLNRPSSDTGSPLRVVAININGGRNLDGIVACLEREPLRRAAIILLCEADLGTHRAGRKKVACEMAKRLNMSYAYLPEFGLRRSEGEVGAYLGNSILSREPLREVFSITLPDPTKGIRPPPSAFRGLSREGGPGALVATIRTEGRDIRVCVAHLDSRCAPGQRGEQMAALLSGFPSDGPAIIGGDLNTTTMNLLAKDAVSKVVRTMLLNPRRFRAPQPYEPLFARLAAAGFEIRGANAQGKSSFTFHGAIPPWLRPRLDWFALRGLAPVPESAAVIRARSGLLAHRVSDHDFIMVDIAV